MSKQLFVKHLRDGWSHTWHTESHGCPKQDPDEFDGGGGSDGGGGGVELESLRAVRGIGECIIGSAVRAKALTTALVLRLPPAR